MPTWFGLGGLNLTPDEMREIAFKTALIHAGVALVIPLLALRVVLPTREIRENRIESMAGRDLGVRASAAREK